MEAQHSAFVLVLVGIIILPARASSFLPDIPPEDIVPVGEERTFGGTEVYLPVSFFNALPIENQEGFICTISPLENETEVVLKFLDLCSKRNGSSKRLAQVQLLKSPSEDVTTINCSGTWYVDGTHVLVSEELGKGERVTLTVTPIAVPYVSYIKVRARPPGGGTVVCTGPDLSPGDRKTTATVDSSADENSTTSDDFRRLRGMSPRSTPSSRDQQQRAPIIYIAGGVAGTLLLCVIIVVVVVVSVRKHRAQRSMEPGSVSTAPSSHAVQTGNAAPALAEGGAVAGSSDENHSPATPVHTAPSMAADATYGHLEQDDGVYNHLLRGPATSARLIKGDNLYGHLGEEENDYDHISRTPRETAGTADVYSNGTE